MSLPTHLTGNASQLPFFCSSNSLLFYLDDPSTFSQVLTLYNPYDFVVRYKVLCTAPKKYSVTEPQGEIRAQHSVDTIVRLLDTSSSSTNQNVVHKIRVQYFDRRKSQELIGKRDITCSILSYKPLEQNFDEEPNITGTTRRTRTNTTTTNPTTVLQQETRDPLVVFILSILGALCAFVLVLPTVPDNENSLSPRIPSYLHMTTNSKIFDCPRIRFSDLPSKLNKLILPSEPIIINHTLCLGTDPKKHACYDIDVEVDDPVRDSTRTFLTPQNTHELEELDGKILQYIDSINQLKQSREFYLSFADDPQGFICKWLASQSRDLKMMTDSSIGNNEEERRADYYTEQWSYEAVSRYFYNKVQQKRAELEQALGIRNP
ncbi:unnamed protein product [Rotaria sp. Silwood1]|nr:unnamed protein product [Rotaria sp. Silwood1]